LVETTHRIIVLSICTMTHSITTDSIMTLRLAALDIMRFCTTTLRIIVLNIMTLSMTTLKITKLNIMPQITKLNIMPLGMASLNYMRLG